MRFRLLGIGSIESCDEGRCCGQQRRRFLQPGAVVGIIATQAAAQLLLWTGGATESDDLHEKTRAIKRSHRGNPAPLVDDTVQAGAFLKRSLLSLGVKAAWECLLDAVPANPAKPALKRRQELRAKLSILQDLEKVPGIGPYRAVRYPKAPRYAMRRTCMELGPGARRGLNLLNGFPLQHDVKSSTRPATLYFAELLARLTNHIIRNLFLLGTDADTDAVRRAKTRHR